MSLMAIFLFPPCCFFWKFRFPLINLISDSTFDSTFKRFFFKFELFSSKVICEEFFRRILKASPLTNPFLTFEG